MSEADLQKAVINLLSIYENQGRLKFFAVPNGGKRNVITAVNLKRQGVRAGVPDIVVVTAMRPTAPGIKSPATPSRTIFLELKAPKGRLSESQTEWRDFFIANSVRFHVVKSLDDVKVALR